MQPWVPPRTVEPIEQFDHVVELLAELEWDSIWNEVTDTERRTLLDEFAATPTWGFQSL